MMISAPTIIDELQKRIKQQFGMKYTIEESNELATNIGEYFVYHQFDEWEDIVDDINNGYDSCCCKEILFKQLNITNIKQKQNEYNRLKQCLNPPIFAKLSQANDIIKDVTKCINQYFVNEFNDKQIAKKISTSFEYIVNEDDFTDFELIKDDMEDIDDSVILSHIIQQIEPTLNSNSSDKQKQIIMIQTEICKIIMQKYHNHITPNNKVSENKKKSKIEKIKTKMFNTLKQEYDEKIVTKILNTFNSVMVEQKYDFECLQDDVDDINDSEILSKLDEIIEIANDDKYDLNHIKITIRDIIISKINFNIKKFYFNVTQNDVDTAQRLMTEHCHDIYKHSMGIKLKPCIKNKYDSAPESKSLTIAKSIAIKNGKPLLYWLLNLYLKERSIKYRDGICDLSQAYNANDWWLENKYCRWIQKHHPNSAIYFKIAIAELVKRPLSVINYNNTLFPIICDRLNDFAQYVLVFHQIAYRMKRYNVTPIQFDYWIIPQMTRNQGREAVFKSEELEQRAMNPNEIISYEIKQKYYTLSQYDDEYIWDIKQILDHPKLSHIEGEDGDYLLEKAEHEFEKLYQQIFNMIGKYQKWNLEEKNDENDQKNICGQTRNRYIFIIDRRNPHNLENQNLSISPVIESRKSWQDKIYLIKPKQYRNENGEPLCLCGAKLVKVQKYLVSNTNKKCGWCQKPINTEKMWQCPQNNNNKHISMYGMNGYYLCIDDYDLCEKARPNTYGKLSTEWEVFPESCLALSKNHILYNAEHNNPMSIKMDDALNGYKFGFSYHLLREDNISVYWYHNSGATKFALHDIIWAFPRFFEKVNGNQQILDKSIIEDINSYDKLPNIEFEEFEKQIKLINELEDLC